MTGLQHGNGSETFYLGQLVNFHLESVSETVEPSSLMFCGCAGLAFLIWRRIRTFR